ncbi:MAG: hypothetical protein RID23_21035 [Roseovarius sp.]
MSEYIRPRRGGAPVFFTVCLVECGSRLLTEEILRVRAAVRRVKEEGPVDVGAWVVLSDYLHVVWTPPPGDAAFSIRWRVIKARFTRGLNVARCRADARSDAGPVARSVSGADAGMCGWGWSRRNGAADALPGVWRNGAFGASFQKACSDGPGGRRAQDILGGITPSGAAGLRRDPNRARRGTSGASGRIGRVENLQKEGAKRHDLFNGPPPR